MSNLNSTKTFYFIEKLYSALEKEQSNDNYFLLHYVMTIWLFKCAVINENVTIIIKKAKNMINFLC